MNIFGIGLPEMAVIGAVALLVFGPKRLPEFGRTLGKTLKGLGQCAQSECGQFWANVNDFEPRETTLLRCETNLLQLNNKNAVSNQK